MLDAVDEELGAAQNYVGVVPFAGCGDGEGGGEFGADAEDGAEGDGACVWRRVWCCS